MEAFGPFRARRGIHLQGHAARFNGGQAQEGVRRSGFEFQIRYGHGELAVESTGIHSARLKALIPFLVFFLGEVELDLLERILARDDLVINFHQVGVVLHRLAHREQ